MTEALSGRVCGRYREDLSAFVDHTLPARRWTEVGYHVAGCEACRREAAEIRGLCQVLSVSASDRPTAPEALAVRLHSIAGEDRDTPLYLSPAAGDGLPSRRRELARQLTRGGVAAVTVLTSIFILALLVAPDPPVVTDPVRQARIEYLVASTAVQLDAFASPALAAAGPQADVASALFADRAMPPTEDWCQGLKSCPLSLAGLPLVARVSAPEGGVEAMHLLYSDGDRILSLCWTPGVLSGSESPAPPNASPEIAAWQTSDGVLSLSTNGGMDMLAQARAELPGEGPFERPLADRLLDGLARIAGIN